MLALDSIIENNDISSTERYILAIATRVESQGSFIISTGSQEKGGCSLIRACSLIRSNTVHAKARKDQSLTDSVVQCHRHTLNGSQVPPANHPVGHSLKLTDRSSIYILKRNGDRIPPCLTPLDTVNFDETERRVLTI